MSDNTSSSSGSPGFERRWRSSETTSYKNLNKQSRLILLSMGVVLVGSLIVGSIYLFGYAKEPKLHCLPVSEYGERWPSPFWYSHDARAMLDTVPESKQNFSVKQNKNDILASLSGLAGDKETATIIYLAGLGARRGNTVYLLPADARPDDPASWLSMEELFAKITALPFEHVLLLLDIASPLTDLYQGPLINEVAEGLDAWLKSNVKFEKNRLLVLTSCAPGEVSQPMASQGKSAFGYYLQQGFQGKANGFGKQGNANRYVSAQELSDFVRTRVNRWSIQNRGQPQHPTLYGTGDFELVHVDKVVVPVATQADSQPAAVETRAESKEDKEKRIKLEREAEDRLLSQIYTERLQRNWQQRDQFILPLLSSSRDAFYGRLEYPEHELQLAIMRKLEHTLHFYENTSLRFLRSLQDEVTQESPFKLLQRVETRTQQDSLQAQQLLASQTWKENGSLSALFPREIPKQPLLELENAYRSAFSTLTATSNAGVSAPEKPATPYVPTAILEVIKADAGKNRPGLHREMLQLCWKNLCDEINPTLAKCERTEQIMKAIISDWKNPRISPECLELQLLDYLIRRQKSTWNYSTNPVVDRLMMNTLHAWLQLEYQAMQLLTAFLPNGLGFSRHQAALQPLFAEHQALAEEFKTARRSGDFEKLTPRIEALTRKYQTMMPTVDLEHRSYTTWWKSLTTLQATAEMMIAADSEKFNDWTNLLAATLLLADLIEQGQYPPDTATRLTEVENARQKLLGHYQQFAQNLIKPADMQSADASVCIALERALQGGMLSAENRREVYRQLIKLHQALHERTVQIESQDTTGQDTALPAADSPQLHATRRRAISQSLLKLAGMNPTQTTDSDWEKSGEALRAAWYQQAPRQLKTCREQGQWFRAARLEAMLPDADSLDAILELRKKESVPYLNWLKQRYEECMARWK